MRPRPDLSCRHPGGRLRHRGHGQARGPPHCLHLEEDGAGRCPAHRRQQEDSRDDREADWHFTGLCRGPPLAQGH